MARQKRNTVLVSTFVVIISSLLVLSCNPTRKREKPNILLIIADDLGWGDVGYHNSDVKTPNLDRLASEGLELDRFYVTPICSPTRAGLLTGRYPDRFGLRNNVVRPWLDFGLDTTEVTLPELLADVGYNNRALVGKWHLGHFRKAYHPLSRGYNYFYGHLNGAIDYFGLKRDGEKDWHENFLPSDDVGYATNLIGKKALQLIRSYSKQDNPFFIQVAFNAPHSPLQATRKYLDQYGFDPQKPTFIKGRGRGNSKRQTYSAMVTHMDDEIGKMLNLMDSLGITENTIVLFMSDNGAELSKGGSNGNLRGAKLTEWEGGVRVPALIKWPGKINEGSTTEQVIGYVDIVPTLLGLMGESIPKSANIDGLDMSDCILGNKSIQRTLYLGNGALINQQYKLIEGGDKIGLTRMKIAEDHFFDVSTDQNEKDNLAPGMLDPYLKMKQEVKAFNEIKPSVPRPKDIKPENFKAPEKWKPVE
ncbi:MAG: arylsulfatase [Bacteroidota bacterium]